MTKPPTWERYQEWARSTLNVRFDGWEKMLFTTNASTILNAAKNHEFFREMRSILATAARDFQSETGARLFAQGKGVEPELSLVTKDFESACNKSYRLNVVRNKNFPEPPAGGWVHPPSWYPHLNDIVRGTLVCAYMDGLPWLAARLKEEANTRKVDVVFNSEEREEGYYAFHVYATMKDILLQVREGNDSPGEQPFDVEIEIQLTTQLQDALREVTHFFYEERRLRGSLVAGWKWLHDEPQFRASYASHSLHLVDAIIVELRNGVRSARGTAPQANATAATTEAQSAADGDLEKEGPANE